MHAVVIGSSLTGLAAALRLAKVGHEVTLLEREDALGGRWRDPALWPPALHLPAAWRDLLRKSGRTLEAELGRRGLALTPAPAALHRLPDGATVTLPTPRGAQTVVLDRALGPGIGARWTALIDAFDDDWQRLRRLGLESDEPLDRARWKALQPRRSLADAAAPLGPAAGLLTWLGWPEPARDVPGFRGAQAAVEREFGAWRITSADGEPVAPTALLDLMRERLDTRGVEVLTGVRAERVEATSVATSALTIHADAVIDATSPWSGLTRPPRGLRPALAPSVSVSEPDVVDPDWAPVVDHATRTLRFPIAAAEGPRLVTWDYAHATEDPSAGAAWHGAGSFKKRPDLVDREGVIRASAASRGGSEPWAQLLTGALAAYVAQERTGGRSIRPADDPRKQRN